MPRYEDRVDTSSFSLFKKLRTSTAEEQIDNANAAIDLLGDEADKHLNKGTEPFYRWQRGCDELSMSVNGFLAKSRVFRVEAIDILEEFIDSFEHTENRFHQFLYIDSISDVDREQIIQQTWNWFSVILRFAIYALVLEYRISPVRRQHL
jgi:hypothetical protein